MPPFFDPKDARGLLIILSIPIFVFYAGRVAVALFFLLRAGFSE